MTTKVTKPSSQVNGARGAQGSTRNSKAVSAVAAKPKPFGLTAKMVTVLKLIAKAGAKGTTRKSLQKATGVKKGWSKLLGSHTVEDGGQSGARCLAGQGLVKYVRDGLSFVYTITDKGKKAIK